MKIQTVVTTFEGRRVRYKTLAPETTSGMPLLLLHGLGCSSEVWKPALRCLAEDGCQRRVIAVDLPGYGRSKGPREAMGMEDLAAWAARFLDELGIDRAHLAGHSMGCQVALAMARIAPERVASAVCVGPTIGDHRVPLWRYVVGLLADGFREPFAYNLVLTRMYAQMGVPRYLATVRKMMEDDPLAHAGDVRAPCLIVRGGRDAVVPEKAAIALAERLPDARYTVADSAAHALPFNDAALFCRVALEFIDSRETVSEPAAKRGV